MCDKIGIDGSKNKLVMKLLYQNFDAPIDVLDADTWLGYIDDLIKREYVKLYVNAEPVEMIEDALDINEVPIVDRGVDEFTPELFCDQNTRDHHLHTPPVSTRREIAIQPDRTLGDEVIDMTSQCGYNWGYVANILSQPLHTPMNDQVMNIRSTPPMMEAGTSRPNVVQSTSTPNMQHRSRSRLEPVMGSSSRMNKFRRSSHNVDLHGTRQELYRPPTFPPSLIVPHTQAGSFMSFLTTPMGQNADTGHRFSMSSINRDRGVHFGSTIDVDNLPPCPETGAYELENPDVLYVGKKFRDRQDMKDKLSYHALKNDYMWRIARVDPDTLSLRCYKNSDCEWKVVGKKVVDPDVDQHRCMNFVITKYVGTHNCGLDFLTDDHSQAKPITIGRFVRDSLLRLGDDFTTRVLMDKVKEKFNVDLTYSRAYQCRQKALEFTGGNVTMSYSKLSSYFYMLKQENPGTKTDIVPDALGRFKYCFMALGSSIEGFKFCRPLIIVDGTHLKTKCEGKLLVAAGVDSDDHIFPLAFAVTDGESLEAWEYFLRKVKDEIEERSDMVFISDRGPGIIGAVRNVFGSHAYHGYCYHHLVMNLNHKFGSTGYCPYTFYEAAYTFSDIRFRQAFQKIIDQDPNETKPVSRYLKEIGFEKWARSQFPGIRYGIMTSNHAESFNNVIRNARKMSIVNLFEFIRTVLQSWSVKWRKLGEECRTELTEKPQSLLNEAIQERRSFRLTKIDDDQYRVGNADTTAKVNMRTRECFCGQFQGLEIPCKHACVAITERLESPYSYCSQYYKNSYFQRTYEGRVYPVPVEEDWIIPEWIKNQKYLVPEPRVREGGETQVTGERRGRTRANRIPSQGEPPGRRTSRMPSQNLAIPGSGRCCSICGNPGHRRNRCPSLTTTRH